MDMYWQPIETAPKDETEILVTGEGYTHVVFWNGSGWVLDGYCRLGTWDSEIRFTPTHWCPIPSGGPTNG